MYLCLNPPQHSFSLDSLRFLFCKMYFSKLQTVFVKASHVCNPKHVCLHLAIQFFGCLFLSFQSVFVSLATCIYQNISPLPKHLKHGCLYLAIQIYWVSPFQSVFVSTAKCICAELSKLLLVFLQRG